MTMTYADETLARMIKGPSNFPTWVLRNALQELQDRRRADRLAAAQAAFDVLIMAEGDDFDPNWTGAITIYCPHDGCHSDDIRQVGVVTRWNVVGFNEKTCGINISDGPDDDGEDHGFICASCERPVTFPETIGNNVTWR